MRDKVLAVSSGGGHWVQLLRLRTAFEGFNVVYATVNPDSQLDIAGCPLYIIPDANRWTKLSLVRCMFSALWIVIRVKPRVVITTGAAPGLFVLVFGKLLGAKTLWLDSIANVEKMSMSGRLARWFSDQWLTQWNDLACPKGPEYKGAVM
ncbi:hypothetical protein B4O97_15945 [Marispirochaeta aestuarii]|uniref:Oligosaccharide biosynthesis protein Alg14 n=1 Tax=Marispirochaeta aestuarii TaxID=1963862 RepID=A0A1Y1RUE4_9SPIO|nr:hypothetical protein [Marispirochaeta aestuarii]ORC32650.1 hypothetical protein B4O97_15945 [Marispirochaeta aestuarii]